MEKIEKFLIDKKLCDNNFLLFYKDYIEFINPKLLSFSGYYENSEKIIFKVPKIINEKNRSVVIHELGHIYDYYINKRLIDNEDTSLLWELTYLESINERELIKSRIKSIDKDTPHYKSLCKIKRR